MTPRLTRTPLHPLLPTLLVLMLLSPVLLPLPQLSARNSRRTLPILRPLAEYQLDIPEPSGLTLDRSGNFLWTVSDARGGGIYAISFRGETLAKLSYSGTDMEGITQDPADGTLYVLEEANRELIQLDRTGRVLASTRLDIPIGSLNAGPEGIAHNPYRKLLYIANEAVPARIVEVSLAPENRGAITRHMNASLQPPYDIIDLSGLEYDYDRDELWVLSDASAKLIVINSSYGIQRGFRLTRLKFEGIALDTARQRLYLVNEAESRLYVYEIPEK